MCAGSNPAGVESSHGCNFFLVLSETQLPTKTPTARPFPAPPRPHHPASDLHLAHLPALQGNQTASHVKLRQHQKSRVQPTYPPFFPRHRARHLLPLSQPVVTMATTTSPAASLLKRQLKEIQMGKDLPGISCGLVNDSNIFEWEVMLMINDDCKYYGGKLLLILF